MSAAVVDAVARYSVSTESLGSRARSGKGKRRLASPAPLKTDYLGSHLAE